MRKRDVCLFGSRSVHSRTKPAQSSGSPGQERGLKRKKTIRQDCSLTLASSETEAGLYFSVCFYTTLGTCQMIRSVLGQGPSKAINKEIP